MSAPATLARTCGRCGGELEHGDLRCPVCALAVPAARAGSEAVRARIVRCDNCGASVSWSADAAAARCAFCDSVTHVEVTADPPEQAQSHLPFTVTPEAAQRALRAFLGRRSFFRPSDLAQASTLASLKPLWWPAWVFSARSLVSWTADSDAGARRAKWAPHSGQSHVTFSDVVISASRGLTAEECQKLAPGYAFTSGRPEPEGPEGARAERFDVTRSGARKRIQDTIEQMAETRIRGDIPGSRVRNVHTAVLVENLQTDRYALPAYVLAYRYKSSLYRVVISGQDERWLVGTAPVSPWKVALAILMALGAAALIAALIALFAGH